LFGMLNYINPDYFAGLKGDVTVPAIAIGVLLLLIGNFTIYRMVNFKV
jgi:Flp pilus assembly protein TadB